MKLGKLELPLYYSNLAVREIENLCGGDMKNLGKLFDGKKVSEEMRAIAEIVTILANADVIKHNTEVSLGLSSDEKREKVEVETVETLLDVGKMTDYVNEIFKTMRGSSKFILPDGIELTAPDIDLEEIEKEKNLRGTTDDTGCA